jgi:hypothetical protein
VTADVSVVVCRGSSCGNVDKHPEVDHDAQLRRFSAAARVYASDCLGPCERSNVVVVRRGTARRWFGDLLADADTNALVEWVAAGANTALSSRLAARQFDPGVSSSVLAQPVALDTEALTRLVEKVLRDRLGAWTLGVEGAGAEFNSAGERPAVSRRGSTIESVSSQGGLRLTISASVRAFSVAVPDTEVIMALFLAVPRASLTAAPRGLTARGLDGDALRAFDREANLYDLAVGHASAAICVRTSDPELQALLASYQDQPWADVHENIGPLLAQRSPHRVIQTPVGRAEVYSIVPAPEGESSPGPHSYLSIEALEVGNELPTLFTLPQGWAPAAMFRPPPGWTIY